jgi:ankyrin repeat protein
MSRSGALDLAKGKKFLKQLLYVQHIDKEKDTASTISEQSLDEYFLGQSNIISDSHFSKYLRDPKANVDILKSYLEEQITSVKVFSNPLEIRPHSGVAFHAFVFFVTYNKASKKKTCWSLEKNGQYIVLQQSPNEDDVTEKLYDAEKKIFVERFGSVKLQEWARGNFKALKNLFQAIWETNQLSTNYHLLFANCQNFASFVFKKANYREFNWSTKTSAIVDRFGCRKKKTEEKSGSSEDLKAKKNLFVNDDKFIYYKAMIEGMREDFEKLAGNLTNEILNGVDSQGYTLFEWATVFSTSDWSIDQFLKGKVAETDADANAVDKGKSSRNKFFIALQYLPSNKESRYLSFDGIDISGVNQTGDSALHLALYGEKWNVAEKILDEFPDYDVNVTNTLGHFPFYLAVRLDCKMVLMKKILAKTNELNVNKIINTTDENTALHYAIENEHKTLVEKLLKEEKVKVNCKNKKDQTALHLAVQWVDIPNDLFRLILEKSANVKVKSGDVKLVNAQDAAGETALHLAMKYRSKTWSKTGTKQLLKHNDVKVTIKNNQEQMALHFAAECNNMPINLFKKILKKLTDDQIDDVQSDQVQSDDGVNKLFVNAQDRYGDTALNNTILRKYKAAVKELLKRDDVKVTIKNNKNQTALHLAAQWKNMPIDLFKKILIDKLTEVNAQDVKGSTALHNAIENKSKAAVEELLKRGNVDMTLKNNKNQTALHLASQWVDIPNDLFRLILGKATDVKEESDQVQVQSDQVQVQSVQVQVQSDQFPVQSDDSVHKFVNAQDQYGDTALHYAITVKSETALNELLKRKVVKVTRKDNDMRTALHLAAEWKTPIDLFKKILKKPADDDVQSDQVQSDDGVIAFVNAQDRYENTALHYAIKKEYKAAVEELLKRNDVKVNLKNKKDQTALHLAVQWVDIPNDLFRLILRKSADVKVESGEVKLVNAQDAAGETALHLAISSKSKTATKQLLEHTDVDMTLKNNKNQTALHLAAQWVDIPNDFFRLSLRKSADVKVESDGVNLVNAQNKDGDTALHYAITVKSETAIKELLKHKDVKVTLKDNNMRTALHLAAEWKTPIDLFKKILKKPADDEVQSDQVQVQSDQVQVQSDQDQVQSDQVLVQSDQVQSDQVQSDQVQQVQSGDIVIKFVNVQDRYGDTALNNTILSKYKAAVEELLKRDDVKVTIKNNKNQTALNLCSMWKDIPAHLLKIINEKTTAENNAEDQNEAT